MMPIKLILGIILIITLAFSAGLFYNTYKDTIRWQKKGLHNYETQVQTQTKEECPAWLKQSPLVTALGVWIGMISNIATLAMAFLSMMFLFWAYKEMRECHDNKNKSMPHLGKAVLCNPPVVDLVKKKLDG
jgi:hypothetical protein